MSRITFLIGAGAPLDLELPEAVSTPSTSNITAEVCKPYTDYLHQGENINIVQEIYDKLLESYPPNDGEERPRINFEQLFHVVEMLYSYDRIWNGECRNPDVFPVFAPFTSSAGVDTRNVSLHSVMRDFILRIMDIINQYDTHFRKNPDANGWYGDFYRKFDRNSARKGDFFILNYDTTIENSIENYEDGFVDDGIQDTFKCFNPRRLFTNPEELPTINHLHGCINYFFSSYQDVNTDVYTYLRDDLGKYPDYDNVRNLMMSRWQNPPTNQQGETYYAAPIITGLRKTDKLNCIPFDFYHANFVNCIVKNNSLVICGYCFGDLYCNQLIERMHDLHGAARRIVLIDKWDIPIEYRHGNGGLRLNQRLGEFLCRAAECRDGNAVVSELYANERNGALYSRNGCLMVIPDGFRRAAEIADDIENFLDS